MVFNLTYTNPDLPYVTPYTFEKAPPKSELSGPLYRNTFTYYSRQLPVPTLTPELRERLIASIQDSARDENGALPVEGTDAFKGMNRELEQARDDNLTKAEIAIFLTREWSKDNGALLRAEVEQAHAFVARYARHRPEPHPPCPALRASTRSWRPWPTAARSGASARA